MPYEETDPTTAVVTESDVTPETPPAEVTTEPEAPAPMDATTEL